MKLKLNNSIMIYDNSEKLFTEVFKKHTPMKTDFVRTL